MVDLQFPKVASALLIAMCVFLGHPASAGAAPENAPAVKPAAARDMARSESGIVGQIAIRPVRPHVTIGQSDTQPYQAKIEVVDSGGHAITTVESDASGIFRVILPPGKYTLQPQSPGLYPRASQQTVVVKPQRFTQVHITYDSGVR